MFTRAAPTVANGKNAGMTDEQGHPDQPQNRRRQGGIRGAFDRVEDEVVREREAAIVPAWRAVTKGEPRLPASLAIIAAIGLQLALPSRFAPQPRVLYPTLAAAVLVGIIVANPKRIDRVSMSLRVASMTLIAVISLSNAWSAGRLIDELVRGSEGQTAAALLATGAAIWATNVMVFSLWYWELDRGGPGARAQGVHRYTDFLFPQMQAGDLAPPDWEPAFADYLYLSFTNATAFSPTDVLPFSRWAKLTMMLQSAIS